nr:MAG TPA: hypothetical protein [Caudoviricetes sp.]
MVLATQKINGIIKVSGETLWIKITWKMRLSLQ